MNLNKCVLSFLNTSSELIYRKLGDISGLEICDSGYKTSNEPPADGWRLYDADIPFKAYDAHFWIRANFRTPAVAENEYLVLRTVTGREGMWDATNPQGLLYLNGKMVQGLDTNHTEAFLDADTEYTLHNYFHTGTYPTGGAIQCKMTVYAVNKDIEHLYYDIKIPYDAAQMLDEGDTDYARIMSVLVDAVRLVDFREPYSESFNASVRNAIDFMEKEFYQKLCTPDGKPVVHCIGHTHIDVEWKWARAQTKEKIQRSFSTAKSLMDRYPEYKFMLSQPNLYEYLKEEAPEKYEELKELVKEGRWEPEGAMYLEPDCNLTSGESLVRQVMFGKKFFRDEFGVESKALFLPDVFGYSAALPQILRKSGVDYFITSKISWNDTNTMPMDAFYWEGIDGTEIFTSFITAQNFGGIPGKGGKNRTTYNGILDASTVKGTWDRFQQKEYTNSIFMTFGHGDGGGGPTKAMLETQRRTARGIPSLPVTKTNTLIPYLETVKSEFDDTCKRTDRTPKWVGELYLEFHRGTYTSIAKVKKNNRYSEFLLGNVEALSTTDLTFGGDYDADGLNENWKKVLHNQFHDILPGSSIGEVYDGTDKDYAEIAEYGNKVVDEKLNAIASRINTDGGVLVYNPTGFERKAVVTQNGYTETNETVPSFGWTVIKSAKADSKVKLDGLTAENEYYILTLNEQGQIVRLYDKRVQREVLTDKGNVLVAFEDYPTKYDAWELEDYYKLKAYELDGKATITPITDGTRAGYVIERTYMHSTIKQTLWLYSESSRIDFETYLDWHEHHQVLKAYFPLDVHTMNATFDVQYGHVTRPTHENTSWDKAKFETYAHKWVDVSENGYGVAMLNDGKYGHAVEGSKLSITLVKCATDPYPEADQGEQSFTYSLMPHLDDFRRGGVIEESYVLNQPLYERKVTANNGDLAECYSFVSVDRPNAVITAVKKAENDNGLIVRFYDAYDCKSNVTLTVPNTYTKAYLCDLMENEVKELTVKDGKVTVPTSNFEIVTVKFYQVLKWDMDNMRKTSELKFNPINFSLCGFAGSTGTKGNVGNFFRTPIAQNISYCVKDTPKTVNEIADALCVSPMYVETEVEYLEEYGFLLKQGDKYIINFLLDEPDENIIKLKDDMYLRAANLFANKLYDSLSSSALLNDPNIVCCNRMVDIDDENRVPIFENDHNFLLWSLIPYITALSGEKYMDDRIKFEEAYTIRPDGGKNICYASVEGNIIPKYFESMKNFCGPCWNGFTDKFILWTIDTEWSKKRIDDKYQIITARDLGIFERFFNDEEISEFEYACMNEKGYMRRYDSDHGQWTSLQIVWIRNAEARKKLLEFGDKIKEKYQAEFDALKAPYIRGVLERTPKHLYKTQMYGLQHIFFSDGWFILHCLKELVNNGKLKLPTEEQKKSLTTLIINN